MVCRGSLLVVDGSGETKAAFHSSVWLMCLLQVPVLCPESADSVQLEAWLSCSLWGPGEPPLAPDPEVLGQHQGQKLDLSPGPQGL